MKQKLILSIAALALGLGSCTSDLDETFFANNGNDVVTVSIAPETRTAFGSDGKSVVWTTGDKIGIFCGTENNIAEYSLKGTPSGNSAEFTGIASGTKNAALYPYNEDATFDETNTITMTLKNEFTYSASSINEAPMAALIDAESQDVILFKNPGAIMTITVNNLPAGYKGAKLSAGEGQKIAGKAQIVFNNGVPTLTIVEDTGNSSDITISFAEPTNDTGKMVFYFPLPVANYTNKLTFSLIKSDNSEQKVFSKVLDAKANKKYFKVFTFDTVSTEIPSEETKGTEEATEALETLTAVVVSVPENDEKKEISLPNAIGDSPVSITFNSIATTGAIKITEASNATVATEVNIGSKEETTANNNLVIELPRSTVSLTEGKFTSVEASTAENTLILKGGVEVETLTVKKGNVRIQKNAKVTTLTKSTELTDIPIVFVEKDATVPSYTGGVFVIVTDENLYNLEKVCSDGGEYTLTDDVTADLVVSAASVKINLGGKKITNKEGDTFTVNSGASLTIEGEGTVDNVSHGKACIYNNGTVALNGGTYTRSVENGVDKNNGGSNTFYAILNHGTMTINEGVTVQANGGFSSLIDNGYYNYGSGNARTGYVSGTNQADPSLTINGGTFSGGVNTIKNDDGATLTIEKGTFTNTSQATVQNNHVATINGGTFTPSSSATHAVESKYYDGGHNTGKTTITGGTFNGEMYVNGANATYEISGGTFSDVNVVSYVTGGEVSVKLEKDVEIKKPAYLQANATVNVDLNGHTVTNKTALDLGKTYKFTEVFKAKDGTLYISDTQGDGKVQALNDDDNLDGYRFAVCAIENATVNISGGSFYNHQNNNQQLDLVEVNNNAKVYITGGTFESGCYGTSDRFWVLNKNNSAKTTCTIEVSGGVFVNFNPAAPNMDDDDSYLKTGFKVKSYTNAICTEGEADATTKHVGTDAASKRWYKVVAE